MIVHWMQCKLPMPVVSCLEGASMPVEIKKVISNLL